MHQEYFDFLTALLATVSAFFWARSALVKFQFGFDMDAELTKAMNATSKLNSWAAGFAALAAATPAVKIALLKLSFLY
ncbi:MAG: hypothetical protein IPJ12_05915 [Betaproteobacteria bacterium]|nr:hypothetical protein [Betaproteobacteria bacterium]